MTLQSLGTQLFCFYSLSALGERIGCALCLHLYTLPISCDTLVDSDCTIYIIADVPSPIILSLKAISEYALEHATVVHLCIMDGSDAFSYFFTYCPWFNLILFCSLFGSPLSHWNRPYPLSLVLQYKAIATPPPPLVRPRNLMQ